MGGESRVVSRFDGLLSPPNTVSHLSGRIIHEAGLWGMGMRDVRHTQATPG